MDLLVLAVSLVAILAGAELFTNGVEWLGHRLDLGEGAVGSVLAAVGTALPETMIPLVAIVFAGGAGADEIGIGAILGAPFMLATLAMFVTGIAVVAFRRRRSAGTGVRVDVGLLAGDARAFLGAYALAIGAAFLPPELGPVGLLVAVGLLLLYARYVAAHLRAERDEALEDPQPLRLARLDRARREGPGAPPGLGVVSVQVAVALACIIVGAAFFVGAVERVAVAAGIDRTLLALLIAPIATELPEKLNSVLWVREGKDNLALGNITGAMVFQSAIPTSIALVFAPRAWTIGAGSGVAFLSAGVAVLSLGAIVLPALRRGRLTGGALLVGGAFYVAYLGVVLALAGPGGVAGG
ncbi:MAG: sodium:calcium antiporter [Chloroflexi bacterium]|nr:sodium:calcium antiporter [Chloroflexota bacterium]